MEAPLLLDTCAVLWILQDAVSEVVVEALNATQAAGLDTRVSPITAWELGLLGRRGRLRTPFTPQSLFQRVLQVPYVRLAEMPPDVLIASSFLPGAPPRDPADRIIVATAREYGYRVVTRDRVILSYAAQGHVQVLAC